MSEAKPKKEKKEKPDLALKTKYPIEKKVLDGWCATRSNFGRANEMTLFIKGVDKGTVHWEDSNSNPMWAAAVNGPTHATARIGYNSGINDLKYRNTEAAMCALEEFLEFIDVMKKKYGVEDKKT